uniref:Uncharacterized protein n=1 Tax=Amphora coffeiformis TaxID=265554 RepID=A0A7S3LCS8_9STRA
MSTTTITAPSSSNSCCWQYNQERCRALQECQVQIKYWKARYQRLKAEHKRLGRLQALRTDAATVWNHLTAREKQQKEYVLAALSCTATKLPAALTNPTSRYWMEVVPVTWQADAELWRARITATGFNALANGTTARQSSSSSSQTHECCIPWFPCMLPMLQRDDDLLVQMVTIDPSMLYLPALQDYLGDDTVVDDDLVVHVFLSVVQNSSQPLVAYESITSVLQIWETTPCSGDTESNSNSNKKKLPFSHSTQEGIASSTNINNIEPDTSQAQRAKMLRNHPGFIQALWKRPVWTKTKRNMLGTELRNNKEFALALANNNNQVENDDDVPFPPDALHALSARLRADIDVVLAFCRRHGGNLSYASYGLRRHYQVVTTAARSCPRAITA